MDKKIYLLIFILGLAIFVRFWGLNYGLPYFLVNDERTLVYGSLKMAELKTLIPAFHPEEFKIMFYAPLISYLYLIFLTPLILIKYLIGSFANFGELANYFILNPGSLWLTARLITALIGVITVYLIYLIGKKLVNVWVGLLAALFLTLSFFNIQFSHFTRPWGPSIFFICLIMLLSLYIYKEPQRKHYLWMGIVGGLGFGAHYAVTFGMFIFAIAHFFSGKLSFQRKIKDKNLWLTIAIFGFFMLVFILLNPQLFFSWTGIPRLTQYSTTAKSLTGYVNTFITYFKILLFSEPVILIFSLLGTSLLWFKSKKLFLIALSWPFIWISCLYLFFYPEFTKPIIHYVVLIIPWLILLASFAVYYFISIFKSSSVKIIILILVFIYPLTTALQYSFLLDQKDTRILAKEWVEENIPAGSKIISDWSYINPTPTKEAILFQKEIDESSLRIADRVLLELDDEKYPQPSYDILKTAYINREKLLPDKDYQYFLTAFWENELVVKNSRLIQEFKQGQVKKPENINADFIRPIFILFSLERLGPTVRIYKYEN